MTPPTSNGHRLTLTFGEGMLSVSVANSSTSGLYSFSLSLPSSSSMDPTTDNRLDRTHKLNENLFIYIYVNSQTKLAHSQQRHIDHNVFFFSGNSTNKHNSFPSQPLALGLSQKKRLYKPCINPESHKP